MEIGEVFEGVVTKIKPYGAFVKIEENVSGMVHISQVQNGFLEDISSVLNVGLAVRVRLVSIGEDGKLAFSIKQASTINKPKIRQNEPPRVWQPREKVATEEPNFEDMMAIFRQNSEESIKDLQKGNKPQQGRRK